MKREYLFFYFLPCLIFFSSIFWIKNSTDYLGWSVVEITGTLLLIRLLSKGEKISLPSKDFLIPLLLLLLWCTCSLFWTCNFHATLTGLYKLFFLVLMTILFFNQPKQWEKAVKSSVIICCLFASIVCLGFYSSFFARINHPNLFSGFLALGGVLLIGLFLDYSGSKQWMILLAALMVLTLLFLTASLAPLIAWLIGLILQFSIKRDKKKFGGLLLLFFVLLSFTFMDHIPLTDSSKINPFRTIRERKLNDPFRFERIQIWKDSLDYFSHYPLLGTGLGTYRDVYPEFKKIEGIRNAPYAHNEIINLICEMGLIGSLLLTWIVWKLLIFFWKTIKLQKESSRWFAVAFTAIVHSFFDFNLRYPPVILLLLFSIFHGFPKRELEINQPNLRFISLSFIIFLGILFSLPGISWVVFVRSKANPDSHQKAALMASRIDPFNGFYHSEIGRMRDLAIAIDLEPRNVWYRRKAAQFFLHRWQTGRKLEDFQSAVEQYREIVKLAPSVSQFRLEADKLEDERSKAKRSRVKG